MLLLLELGLVVLALVLTFVWPRFGANGFEYAERKLSGLAHRPKLAVLAAGFAALALRAAVLPILPVPQPIVADEFSHLLAADTFSHGRLTNPTPPLWVHFETLHVLMKPTYMSMYPPGQGLLLAFGEVIAGSAFLAVWLSIGLMCAAICWMLQGWFSPDWALLGGFLAAMRFGVFSYWANSYWGGTAAATGGALVLGALPRITRFARRSDALWMGLGLAILANTRPYEGLIFALPAAYVFFQWLCGQRGESLRLAARRVVLPLALVGTVTAAAIGYYNWRVSGNPLRLPQEVARETYAVAPYFLWESPRPTPVYHHAELRGFYLHNELMFYQEGRTLLGALSILAVRYSHLWSFYLGPTLTLPFMVALTIAPYGTAWRGSNRETHFLVIATTVSVAGLTAEVFFFPHYAAPMTCLILALVLEAMRRVREWHWHGQPAGRCITRAVPAICFLMLILRAGIPAWHLPIRPAWPEMAYNSVPSESYRTQAESRLDSIPGRHLVLVQDVAGGERAQDWVYNAAALEQARIIWAWDMGPAGNEELIRRFNERDVWFVERDRIPPRLTRYEPATGR